MHKTMPLENAINRSREHLLTHQFKEGYWWYTLEANDSILAEFLLFHRYMGIELESSRVEGLIERLLSSQNDDGSWSLYQGGEGSVGATTECYFALKLYHLSPQDKAMTKARDFILSKGGALKSWVFTRIHLAMFGLLPWEAAPEMPIWFALLPSQAPINLLEFSSWARASIVPLLVILHHKKVVDPGITLSELFPHPPTPADWRFTTDTGFFSAENGFILFDRFLKKFPSLQLFKKKALAHCEKWIVDHLMVTEDIFPALMYGAVALHLLGHDPKSGALGKALTALRSFQMGYRGLALPAIPKKAGLGDKVYQQCCISPTWDTAWAGVALISAGALDHPPEHRTLIAAAKWLLDMQITSAYGDWAEKVKNCKPGGWAFEFQNDAFPDVDDTVEIMQFLDRLPLDPNDLEGQAQKKKALSLALDWVLAMQSENGGWGAFDKDNVRTIVNRIPFSDHKACLDPPTADLSARVLETLAQFGFRRGMDSIDRGIAFVLKEQTPFGAWGGRWGVNYIYGTWAVLQGLSALGIPPDDPAMARGISWLLSVQNKDGGWSESCESYDRECFVPLAQSTASQTAWAVLALVACGLAGTDACARGIDFLIRTQTEHGGWEEAAFTGTGFPKHFYIRYHGYRYYFPLLALGKYREATNKKGR